MKQAMTTKFSQLIKGNSGVGNSGQNQLRQVRQPTQQYDTQRSQNSTMMNVDAFSS